LRDVRRRFWCELGLCVLSATLFAVTLVWHDWIELVFGFDPDQGNGALEWVISALSAAGAVSFAVLARVELRLAAAARAARE
jgi:hypothetical protein